jgi:hypothetical protein
LQTFRTGPPGRYDGQASQSPNKHWVALATFKRHGVNARIRSRFGTISTHKSAKHGFGDMLTLHAIIEDPLDPAIGLPEPEQTPNQSTQ